ncbi:hypothetical protein [Micromonospora sp. b486]|uniref:hypothetical protein n=1 Tax=Micromonospora sp. b486 TaxID=3053986 RepID=UPI00259C89D0|nr:hypothetical protein [Micromonospora sp. b486]MDM4784543.1 hypothetical protein [Micromonospora sp. b486]
MAQRLGITFRADSDAAFARDDAANWGAFTLGVAATTPLDLANAYATVAAEGTYCTPLPVVSVTAPDGDAVDVAQPSCKRVLERTWPAPPPTRPAARSASSPRSTSATAAPPPPSTGSSAARGGKTGSSERNATETFVGYTPQVAVAGIAANPDDVTDLVGSAVQAKVIDAVARTIKTALTGKPVADFTAPSRALVGDPQRPQPPRRTEPTGASSARRASCPPTCSAGCAAAGKEGPFLTPQVEQGPFLTPATVRGHRRRAHRRLQRRIDGTAEQRHAVGAAERPASRFRRRRADPEAHLHLPVPPATRIQPADHRAGQGRPTLRLRRGGQRQPYGRGAPAASAPSSQRVRSADSGAQPLSLPATVTLRAGAPRSGPPRRPRRCCRAGR